MVDDYEPGVLSAVQVRERINMRSGAGLASRREPLRRAGRAGRILADQGRTRRLSAGCGVPMTLPWFLLALAWLTLMGHA